MDSPYRIKNGIGPASATRSARHVSESPLLCHGPDEIGTVDSAPVHDRRNLIRRQIVRWHGSKHGRITARERPVFTTGPRPMPALPSKGR